MIQNIQENKLASGLLFIHAVEFLKSKKGDDALRQLENQNGEMLFDRHRMYPLEQLIKLQRDVIRLSFGEESDEGYRALGKYTFESFVHSLIGATLTNVVPTPKVLLSKIQQLWGSVINFGERKLTFIDEREGRAIIEIKDDPRKPPYIQGVIETGLASTDVKNPRTKIVGGDGDYSIEITWQV